MKEIITEAFSLSDYTKRLSSVLSQNQENFNLLLRLENYEIYSIKDPEETTKKLIKNIHDRISKTNHNKTFLYY
ncbi:MAG: hypothetical protein N3A54_00835, partial [Patescibacteria group bacterium]|nr:hypothetical protein [Patescibacteria group bacterium]